MSDLTGKAVAVVGASSGIGLATARLASKNGARIVMLSRSEEKLTRAAQSVAGDPIIVALDATDVDAVNRAARKLGQIDHLVLTAVANELKRTSIIASVTDEQVERSFDRIRSYVTIIRAFVPQLAERGSITLMCGASAIKPPKSGFTLLAAESASVTGFGRALALELAPIRVNVVMAGVVDTPIHDHDHDDLKVWAERALPARRFGQPGDIAHAILFLMTNPYATAQTYIVDGGITAL